MKALARTLPVLGYLLSCCACSLGVGFVFAMLFLSFALDFVLGALAGDLRQRWSRPR